MSSSLDGDGVHDRLHGASDTGWTKREQKFPNLISHHLFGVYVLEYVNAVPRDPAATVRSISQV